MSTGGMSLVAEVCGNDSRFDSYVRNEITNELWTRGAMCSCNHLIMKMKKRNIPGREVANSEKSLLVDARSTTSAAQISAQHRLHPLLNSI